jgi:phosphoserine phosphatase
MARGNSDLHTISNLDGAAILDVDHGLISTLNTTGAYVWEELKRGVTPATIVDQLTQMTDQDASTVDHDVREFIASLKAYHLWSD